MSKKIDNLNKFISNHYKQEIPKHLINTNTGFLFSSPIIHKGKIIDRDSLPTKTTISKLSQLNDLEKEIQEEIAKRLNQFFINLVTKKIKEQIKLLFSILPLLRTKNDNEDSAEKLGQRLMTQFLQTQLPPFSSKLYYGLLKVKQEKLKSEFFVPLLKAKMKEAILLLLECESSEIKSTRRLIDCFPEITPKILQIFDGPFQLRFHKVTSNLEAKEEQIFGSFVEINQTHFDEKDIFSVLFQFIEDQLETNAKLRNEISEIHQLINKKNLVKKEMNKKEMNKKEMNKKEMNKKEINKKEINKK
ncbi:hypothetical protein M0811_01813 [Anaeramoeba ignava]|uniref:Uncharacterized protein n=1 Tax=Anaeramoeba ignava TaxID=1746090 RepID=A0A9Q0LDF0_ANAIG|nr:hypothetical protein M0811_01813 [Anaeramoeba ignava]